MVGGGEFIGTHAMLKNWGVLPYWKYDIFEKHLINIYILVLKLLLGLVVFVIQLNNCEWKHWLYA